MKNLDFYFQTLLASLSLRRSSISFLHPLSTLLRLEFAWTHRIPREFMDGSRRNAQNMEAAAKIYGFVVFRFDVRARCSQLRKEEDRGKKWIHAMYMYIGISAIVISPPIEENGSSSTSEKILVIIIIIIYFCILYWDCYMKILLFLVNCIATNSTILMYTGN